MAYRIITTGGTFEKHYNPIAGSLGFEDSHLSEITDRMRLARPVTCETLMLVDSLDMLDAHRQRVLDACRASTEKRIIIIHGTDTMAETGRVLGAAQLDKTQDKTIVITGAMVPYEVAGSDALFNLGFALGAASQCAPGVYIAMNARVHPWQTVYKNRALGIFES
jgi:L-asparaginase